MKKKEIKKKKPVEVIKGEAPLREIKVRIVGVGGGGGSIISSISTKLKKVFFSVANTDVHSLEEITKKRNIRGVAFGKKLTGGLGTGMDPKMGKQAAEEDLEDVKKLFKNQDIVIFVASLGGGTGSGAVPVFAAAAQEMGCLVYGVFTLPFSFEGEKKTRIAKEAIKEANPHLDAITILPNEKIFEIVDKNTPLRNALEVVNTSLVESLEGLIETIYETGLVNIDFADVRTVLENKKEARKLTYLNTIEGKLEGGVQELVKRAMSNPLYPYTINKARGILFNITGGKDIGLMDISSISESISRHTDDDARIIIGITQRNNYKNKVKIAILATGCGTDFLKKELGEEKKEEAEKPKREEKKERSEQKSKKIKKRNEPKEKKESEKETKKKETVITVKKEEEKKITVAPDIGRIISLNDEKPKVPENEEERKMLEEEERWEKPSFLKNNN
jgi:cell division protein FtsZ